MPLTPEARILLDQLASAGAPPIHEMPIEQIRATETAFARMGAGPVVEVATVEHRELPGPEGGDIPLRVYTPRGEPPFPVVAYLHGGGFVLGTLETHDHMCRSLADASGAVVASVQYRLAPEHRFPAAIEDAYAATCWAAENLGGTVAVAGDSAGGNLAAAIALMARDRGGPELACQVLIYPVIDVGCDTTSFTENAEGYLLDANTMRWFWEQYLDNTSAGDDPRACPSRAADLSDVAPAFVITAEFDPLRDEAEAYAARLQEAGVPVTVRRYDGMIHGFVGMPALLPEGAQAMREIGEALRSAFSRALTFRAR